MKKIAIAGLATILVAATGFGGTAVLAQAPGNQGTPDRMPSNDVHDDDDEPDSANDDPL